MREALQTLQHRSIDPLDAVEDVLLACEYEYERRDGEIVIDGGNGECAIGLFFAWEAELETLQVTGVIDMSLIAAERPALYELLAVANERLWMGHFALWGDEGLPMFRHSLYMGGGLRLNHDHVLNVIETAFAECERFAPAFRFLAERSGTARQAVDAALLYTMGEA